MVSKQPIEGGQGLSIFFTNYKMAHSAEAGECSYKIKPFGTFKIALKVKATPLWNGFALALVMLIVICISTIVHHFYRKVINPLLLEHVLALQLF